MNNGLSIGFGQTPVNQQGSGTAATAMKQLQLQQQIIAIEEKNPNDPRLNNLKQQLELLEPKQEKQVKNIFNFA